MNENKLKLLKKLNEEVPEEVGKLLFKIIEDHTEKVGPYRTTSDGELIYYEDDEENKGLKAYLSDILKNYDYNPEKSDAFIKSISILLYAMKNLNSDKKSSKDKTFLKSCRDNLKKTLKILKKLKKFEPLRSFTPEHLKRDPYFFYLTFFESLSISEKSLEVLFQVVDDVFKSDHWELPKSRKDIAYKITKSWFEYFDKIPPKKKEGPFWETILACFDYIGLPSKDPEKTVYPAIDKINRQP